MTIRAILWRHFNATQDFPHKGPVMRSFDAALLIWTSCRTGRRLAGHYCDVIMGAMASQITSITIVYSTVHLDADQRKHQSSASLAFVPGIHRWPVNSPHKWPVTRKMFPFDDVIMDLRPHDSHVMSPSWEKDGQHGVTVTNKCCWSPLWWLEAMAVHLRRITWCQGIV